MAKVADYVLNRLTEWGIHRIYGYPGDGINGFLGALDRAKSDPEFIQPRHEEMGAFMATAHAKFTGEVGCCMATSGGGAIVAISQRAVATIIFPVDVQEEDAQPSPPRMHGAVYTSIGFTKPRVIPPDTELRKTADILNEGTKVAILIGQGAAEAADEVVEAAELLGAGVAKALLGREVLPDDLPYVTGPIGLLGSTASYELMMGADTLFMIGTSFPYAEWLPEEGQCKGVEIDIDARR